jgi:hypothetical protein
MDTTKIKKVGTREEVFKGIAERTAGGLKKDDINEKHFSNRTIYISKKLSDRMKINIASLRINNPNYFKRLQKKTMVNTNVNANTTLNSDIINKANLHNQLILKKKHNTKTQKLAFKVKENSVKTVFYPELQGINIKELKEELIREEDEEDLGTVLQPQKNKDSFTIEDMPDVDMKELYL